LLVNAAAGHAQPLNLDRYCKLTMPMWTAILTGALAMLQTDAKLLRQPGHNVIVSFLDKEADRLQSPEILQLAQKARDPDALDKVKDMIKSMISQHSDALNEMTDHKAFCDKEMRASKAQLARQDRELEKKKADKDLKSAKLAEIKDRTDDLHAAIAKAHKDKIKEAAKREKEKAEYTAKWQDLNELVTKYSKRNFDDSEEKRAEVEKKETEALTKRIRLEDEEQGKQYRYDEWVKDLEVSMAAKEAEVKNNGRKTIQMESDLSTTERDVRDLTEEFGASKEYAVKMKSTCTVRTDPYKDRQRRRSEQIQSLKEAYEILHGREIPVMDD